VLGGFRVQAPLRQHLEAARVQASAHRSREIVVERLGEQRVDEAHPTRTALLDQTAAAKALDGSVGLVLIQPGHLRREFQAEANPERACGSRAP